MIRVAAKKLMSDFVINCKRFVFIKLKIVFVLNVIVSELERKSSNKS